MIRAIGISKRFGERVVLRDLSLEVPGGRVTLLVGSNGAGKTTLMRVLTGLSVPDAGQVELGGEVLSSGNFAALAKVSFLPQSPRFHPRLTTLQVAEFYARLRAKTGTPVREELERWGLQEHLNTITAHLSGGLRQRLAIAVFALARAQVLLLDEPGLSLDPEWRARLQLHLSGEAARGAAVLVATHLVGEWENRAEDCILLGSGRVKGQFPADQLRYHFRGLEPVELR